MSRDAWLIEVQKVFNVVPRDGSIEGTVWIERTEEQNKLHDLLGLVGVHICIDGSTGTGKSSLAITELHKSKLKYVLVQLTQATTWAELCRQLVQRVPSTRENSASAELEAGLDGVIPKLGFRVSLGTSNRASDSIGVGESIASSWSEHDVCQMLYNEQKVLLIDDFDQANEEIQRRTVGMCRLLTETYVHPKAKLVIVGTDDICQRLFRINRSLEGRLEEVSLGTFPDSGLSWKFLQMGFNKLNVAHPGKDSKLVEPRFLTDSDNSICMQAIYIAADGLPKSLNQLGKDISLKAVNLNGSRRGQKGNGRITVYDITSTSKSAPMRNLSNFEMQFPRILGLVRRSGEARMVLAYLYKSGIGRVFSWAHIVSVLSYTLPQESVNTALNELVECNFLVRTGRYNDVLFVFDPALAHTLAVIASNPTEYGQSVEAFGPLAQLSLPLYPSASALPPSPSELS
jgi:AAA domain